MHLLAIGLISIFFAGSVQARSQIYNCTYTKQASLIDGEVEVGRVKDFKISVLVDMEENKSYLLGNNGSSKVIKVNNSGGLTFIEITDSGNVSTTTITDDLHTVHSRNSIIPIGKIELIPSQYYGKCTLK